MGQTGFVLVCLCVCMVVAVGAVTAASQALARAGRALRRIEGLDGRLDVLNAAHGRVSVKHGEDLQRLDGAVVGLKARLASAEKKSATLSTQLKEEGVARFSGDALHKGWLSDLRARVCALETGEPRSFLFPDGGLEMDRAMEQEASKPETKPKAKASRTKKKEG